MRPFLEKIADRLLKKFPVSMDGIAVVLPSKRSVVFLKHYLSQKIDKPIFLPDFYSIEEFIEELSGLQVLDNISLQFKLYQTYTKYPPKKIDSFDDFLKWSNVLLHDFNDIDRNLVDAKSIYLNLKEVKELESWSVSDWSFSEENLSDMQNNYIGFFEGILDWYEDFNTSLLKDNLAYQGMTYKAAVNQINNIDIKWNKVWFVGLNALTKAEQSVIDFLKKRDIARVFWDADIFYYNNSLHEAGGFLRQQRERWSEIDFKGVGDYFNQPKTSFNVIACPKNITQAKVASEIITSFQKKDLEDSKTAIVLADESLLFPVLHNLPSAIKKLNVTMGSPLKHSSLFSFIDCIFTMQLNAIKYKKQCFYYKDFLIVIQHSYCSKIIDSKVLKDFKNSIIEGNIVFITKKNIDSCFIDNHLIKSIFSIWKNIEQALETFTIIVEQLRLSLVGVRGSIASEVLATFYNSLLIVKKLVFENNFEIELKTLYAIMHQLVAKEIIPFKGEPLEGVQLMGILESRTLDFKNVIMLSVNEGKLPKGKLINSFIPYDMKRYFKLPTYSDSDAVFSYHFYRLLQRANNVSLIYNSETDDFGSGEKSRFITQLLSEYQGEIKDFVYKGKDLDISNSINISIKNIGLEPEIKAWASKGVSPSAINMYNRCSLSFYYHYLAKIREDDGVDEYADASTVGTAIHNALENFYPLGIINEQVIKDNTSAILADIKNNFVSVFSEEGMKEGKNYLSLKIAQKITADFLDMEINLVKKTSRDSKLINIIKKEEELRCFITVDGIDFNLIGKADRVDIEGDRLRVIDYKTGKVDVNEVAFTDYDEVIDDTGKGKAFQLLMYSYLYLKMNPKYIGTDVIAGIFSFKNLKPGLIKVSKKINSRKKDTLIIDNNVLNSFEKQLERVLTKIISDDFTPCLNSSCNYCNKIYSNICEN